MAAKIRIQGESLPISKNAACCLVRRLLACWIVRNQLIQRLTPAQPLPASQFQPRRKAYIPAKLPHAELPGIRFKMPPLTKPLFPDKVFKDWPELI